MGNDHPHYVRPEDRARPQDPGTFARYAAGPGSEFVPHDYQRKVFGQPESIEDREAQLLRACIAQAATTGRQRWREAGYPGEPEWFIADEILSIVIAVPEHRYMLFAAMGLSADSLHTMLREPDVSDAELAERVAKLPPVPDDRFVD